MGRFELKNVRECKDGFTQENDMNEHHRTVRREVGEWEEVKDEI